VNKLACHALGRGPAKRGDSFTFPNGEFAKLQNTDVKEEGGPLKGGSGSFKKAKKGFSFGKQTRDKYRRRR